MPPKETTYEAAVFKALKVSPIVKGKKRAQFKINSLSVETDFRIFRAEKNYDTKLYRVESEMKRSFGIEFMISEMSEHELFFELEKIFNE